MWACSGTQQDANRVAVRRLFENFGGRTPAELTEGKCKRLGTGVEELDFKCGIFNGAPLPYELVHSRLADLALAIGRRIETVTVTRLGAVQPHPEPNRRLIPR